MNSSQVVSYIEFKIKQYVRITGFNIKKENAKDDLKNKVKPLLEDWIKEYICAVEG